MRRWDFGVPGLMIAFSSAWRCCRYWPSWPRTVRWCASSTTRTGWTGRRPSALVFAARRLDAEGIAIIFTARDHHAVFPASGLRFLRLGGLDAASAAALLADYVEGLAPTVRSRIVAEAGGNPLGLIELPAAYLAAPPAAGWSGNTTLALTDRLQQAFEGQIRRLPADTRTMLLAAASEDSGDLGVLLDAAGTLGSGGCGPGAGRAGGADRHRRPYGDVPPSAGACGAVHGATLSQRLAVHRALADALLQPSGCRPAGVAPGGRGDRAG